MRRRGLITLIALFVLVSCTAAHSASLNGQPTPSAYNPYPPGLLSPVGGWLFDGYPMDGK
jgi:hypothetical protein